MEIIVVIAIMAIIISIIVPNLANFRNEQALKNATADIMSLLNKAKSDANSLSVDTNYGVHFETGRAVYFVGDSFTEPNVNNKEVIIPSSVSIPLGGISLNGGGSNIIFTRLTGDDRGYVTGYGTITLQLTSNPTRTKVITINKSGSISVN